MERKITRLIPLSIEHTALQMKRVAAYARVSNGKDAMLHSLSAQISYYSKLIQKTPSWEYAGVYADEAVTGTKSTRAEFQRLLADCRAGKIDMIITKSVSRFARNTLTTLQVIRELKALNVDVYFEEQNIHTLGGDGEFLLTLLAVYAQEEARSVSENQKWRIKENFDQGLPWTVTMYGYRQVGGDLEIVPEEAAAIRMAADLYLQGQGGIQIARALNAAGYRTRRGNLWRRNHIADLLSNEKLAGDLLLQKTYVVDPIDKVNRKNNGERRQVKVADNHEPILDRDVYEHLLAERERRAVKYAPEVREQHTYPFTGMIVCEKCGASFRRKTANAGGKYEKKVWICVTYNTHGKAHCAAKQIPEDILEEAAAQALGLPKFDAEEFSRRVQQIRVPENGALIFAFHNGTTTQLSWENPSRRHSWTEAARQRASEQAAENRRARRCAI